MEKDNELFAYSEGRFFVCHGAENYTARRYDGTWNSSAKAGGG
jgi:hypothetical protein